VRPYKLEAPAADGPFHVPALPIAVIDTTEAGDAFVAGVSHARGGGADLRRAMEIASRVAAWTVSSPESVCRDLPERIAAGGWE
jgi:sugar/nucleoside kinase (ribokinase family)